MIRIVLLVSLHRLVKCDLVIFPWLDVLFYSTLTFSRAQSYKLCTTVQVWTCDDSNNAVWFKKGFLTAF